VKSSFIRPNLTDNAENLKCQQDGSSLGAMILALAKILPPPGRLS
jgi:hypothetical protein